MAQIKLKAGTYYVGDPCYVFGENWSKVIKSENFCNSNETTKIFGFDCFTASTGGDGTLDDNFGRSYSIDSGTFSVIPIELLNVDKKQTIEKIHVKNNMHIIDFKHDFNVCDDDGVFLIDNITINYGNYDDCDDYDYYDDECSYSDEEDCPDNEDF